MAANSLLVAANSARQTNSPTIDEQLQRVRKSIHVNTDLAVRFVLAEIHYLAKGARE